MSGGCLVSVLGLLVVSGVCWVVSGGCFRHFFRSGHFVPPPHDIRESRTPCLIGLSFMFFYLVAILPEVFYLVAILPDVSKISLDSANTQNTLKGNQLKEKR